MSENKNIVIIGPSKSGKTALVASLYHAATILNTKINDDDYTVEIIPKNEPTIQLFQNIHALLRTGSMGSVVSGTRTMQNYHLQMTAPDPSPTFFERLKDFFGQDDDDICDIHFPDAPGGAIFRMSKEEVDDHGLDVEREKVVTQLAKSFGLIICIDAALLSSGDEDSFQREMALNFAQWLPGLFAEILEKQGPSPDQRLNLRRVCFVFTKADLWAKNNNLAERAEISVHNRNAYDHAVDILGKAFFTGIRQFFSTETEIAFYMSSVYGFHQGRLQDKFFEEMDEDDIMMLDEWVPFNVIEPFLTAVDATPPNTFVTIKTKSELGR